MDCNLLVIIVTYNGSRFIEECVKSIYFTQNVPDVLIVDNASTDNTVEIVKLNFPNVNLIVNNENLGFGRANNIGLKYAIDNQYNAVFLLNQDTVIFPDTFSNLFILFNRLDNVGFVSPVHLDKTMKSLESNFEYFLNKSFKRKLISKMFFREEGQNYAEIDFVNAAAWLIPVSTLKIVGGFNPIFPHYSEDIDYFNRLKSFGFKNYIVFNSFIVHYSSNGIADLDFNYSMRRELFERVAILSNINFSFKYLFREQLLKFFYNVIVFIYPFQWKKIKFEFFIFFNLIIKIRSIFVGRNISKKGFSFIE